MKPSALLLGQAPDAELGFEYTAGAPYDAVMIGTLSVRALLYPENEVMTALMEGKPVYVWRGGMEHRQLGGNASPALYEKCLAMEREWRSWGAQFLSDAPKPPLITAARAARLATAGTLLPVGRMTPLARDILGGSI